MQDCHAVFQPSYTRLIRFRNFWALSSVALGADASPLSSARSPRCAPAATAAPLSHPTSRSALAVPTAPVGAVGR